MSKTPKTIIATIAAAVVIIGGITAAVIATNHENTPSSGSQTRQESQQASSDSQTRQESQQTSSDAESDQDNQQASSDTDENVFWLRTVDWGEEKDLTGITLFNGECTTPISLDDFDGDEHLGPYCTRYITPGNWDFVYSYNLTELFNDITIGKGAHWFSTQESYENERFVNHGEEDPATISNIYICNYTEEKVSLRQAYENNWFYIASYSSFLMEFSDNENNVSNKTAMVEAMIEKYGRPSYLIAHEAVFFEDYKNNNGSIVYTLVWEKEDFVLTMEIFEVIIDNGIYSMSFDGECFKYITREIWDGYMEDEYFDYEQEVFKIYDLDDLR